MSIAAAAGIIFGLAVLLALAGRGLLTAFGLAVPLRTLPLELRWALHLGAGWLALAGLQLLQHLAGIPWELGNHGLLLLIFATYGFIPLFRRGQAAPGEEEAGKGGLKVAWRRIAGCARGIRLGGGTGGTGIGWGDALAVLALLALGGSISLFWSTNPDFVYHWGVKGHRFFLAQGVDMDYLSRPWNVFSHPDYPLLLPGLFAATASVIGSFHEAPMLLWTVACVAALVAAARGTLRLAGASTFTVQGTTAAVALILAFFGIAHESGGSPDTWIALSLVLAAPALLRPGLSEGRSPDGRATAALVAVAAALAATAKLEGAPLAVLMVGVYGWKEGLWRTLAGWKRWALVAAVPALLAGPWVVEARILGLSERVNAGPFDSGHAGEIFSALGRALLHPHWNGAAVVLLVAAFACLGSRRLRPWVAVGLLQLAVYVLFYFTDLIDPGHHVSLSFPRVLVHFVPAWALAAGLALDSFSPARDLSPVSVSPGTR